MEAYLLLSSKLLTVHDTRAVQHTVRNIQSLLGKLMPQPHYQRFLANTILSAALHCYSDAYFAESNSEVIDLITQIYCADTTGDARTLFLSLPGITASHLDSYGAITPDHKIYRSKRQSTKELLAEIKGLTTTEQGRKQVDLGPDTSARSMMQNLAFEAAAKAKRDRGDLLSHEESASAKGEEGAVLPLLFGNA
jgi:Exportin-5 family